jgi:hypothetical protein
MTALALLALALAAGPARPHPVALQLRAGEDSDEQALVDLCRLPGARLELRTRSNMLATGTLEALQRCAAPRVLLRAPLLPVQRERLGKLPRAEPVFELPEAARLDWAEVSRLGPRRVHLRLGGPLTAERAAQLARFRDVEVELDLRGRDASAEELARFRGLDHADRAVRLGADAAPELVAALALLEPVRLTVEARDNHLPAPLLQALADSELPVGVALVWPFLPRDVEALAAIPRLGLEVELGTLADAPRGLSKALAPVEPDLSKPAGSAAPGPELPGR